MMIDKWGFVPFEDDEEKEPRLIGDVIVAFSKDVIKRGDQTIYPTLYRALEEYIQENIEEFTDEAPF